MLGSEELNIFDHLDKDDWKKVRELIIAVVLGTDMSKHFIDLKEWKSRLTSRDFEPRGKDKRICQVQTVHLADLSNPTKQWFVCYKWTELLFVEFFNQGDREKVNKIPISFLMDRESTNLAKAQIGFIENLIKPSFEVFQMMLPNVVYNLRNLEINK